MLKVSYLTTKYFPASTADHVYISKLSEALAGLLGERFNLIVSKTGIDIAKTNPIDLPKVFENRTINLILFLTSSRGKNYSKERIFIFNDFYIGLITIFIKVLFSRNAKLIFDNHMLSESWKDRFVLSRVDGVVNTSYMLAQKVIDLGVNPAKIHTILGGVDDELYRNFKEGEFLDIRKELGFSDTDIVIGYVGGFKSLNLDKGLPLIFSALKSLNHKYKALFVGGTEKEISEYTSLAKAIGVENRCVFVQKVPLERVPQFQMISDILAIPYPNKPHFSNYGFPMKVYEYLATNKPIIYSNLKITDDVLCKFEGCVPFEADDVESFVDSILKIENIYYNTILNRNIGDLTWNAKARNIIKLIESYD